MTRNEPKPSQGHSTNTQPEHSGSVKPGAGAIESALRENPDATHLLKLLQQTHEQRLRLYRREQLVG